MRIGIGGAGIGGLGVATLLANQGHEIVLFDRFSTPAPVGSGLMLQETGLRVLESLGLRGQVESKGAPIKRLFGLSQPSGRTVLDVRFEALRDSLQALGIQRASLFDVLFEAADRAGVSFEGGREIVAADPSEGRFIFQGSTQSARFDLLVDALGANSPLSSDPRSELPFGALWATIAWPKGPGFQADALEQRYRAAYQMMGLMPSGQHPTKDMASATFFWSIEAKAHAEWKAEGLQAWRQDALDLWPETEPILDNLSVEAFTFARYRHRTHSRPVEDRLIHIGDSWHATSPQLGQGANMALLDAYALGLAAQQFKDNSAQLGKTYTQLRRRHIELYQAMSYLFTPVYQSKGKLLPALRDGLVAPLSRLWPVPSLLGWLSLGRIFVSLAAARFNGGCTNP